MRGMRDQEKNSLPGRPQGGFSLIELMVSMVLFLIVSTAVWGVLRIGLNSRKVVSKKVDVAKTVRVALNTLGRDTLNAGYGYPLGSTVVLTDNRITTLLGIPNDSDASRDTVPPIIAGNQVTVDNYNPTANKTDQVTFLFKDNAFNVSGSGATAVSLPLNINAATTNSSGIDEIVPISGSNSACRVNDLYLITGNTGSTLAVATALSGTNKLQFSNGDVLGINVAGTTGPLRSITTPASIVRVKMVTYFVASDGTLIRREYANRGAGSPAYEDVPLVYNVENFQIKYVMNDGSLSDNPSAGPDGIPGTSDDTQANLTAIRQVRFTVGARTQELDAAGRPFVESMTVTYSTRNLGYDAS
jgi:prepilin-type N-terminal cleavage/methylation domain-containing protein